MEDTKIVTTVGEADREHLAMAGRWAFFIAIVYFVLIGIGIVGMIFGLLAVGAAGAIFPGLPASFGTWYFTLMLCVMALMIIPTLYLYRFGVNALAAVKGDDEAAMSHSLANLGRLFRFMGIYIIVVLGLCLTALIVAVIAGLGAAAAGAM